MLVHNVYFWLERGLDEKKRREFLEGLRSLKNIEAVETLLTGAPAPTARPVIDRTYDFGLTVIMKDMQAHDSYQNHPLHKAFIEKFSPFWIKVVIYDHEDPEAV